MPKLYYKRYTPEEWEIAKEIVATHKVWDTELNDRIQLMVDRCKDIGSKISWRDAKEAIMQLTYRKDPDSSSSGECHLRDRDPWINVFVPPNTEISHVASTVGHEIGHLKQKLPYRTAEEKLISELAASYYSYSKGGDIDRYTESLDTIDRKYYRCGLSSNLKMGKSFDQYRQEVESRVDNKIVVQD